MIWLCHIAEFAKHEKVKLLIKVTICYEEKRFTLSVRGKFQHFQRKLFCLEVLTLRAPITTAADDIHKYFFHCFSEKIRHDVSSESSAKQRIHMKNQALFSLKDKSKKIKMSSAASSVWRFKG